jgi:hypothetical protein
MRGTPLFLSALLGVLCVLTPAFAQGEKAPPKPGKKGWKGGRVKFKRAQGSSKELEAKIKGFMKELAVRYPMRKPGKDGKDGGGLTPPTPKKPGEKPGKDGKKKDPLLELMRTWRPTKAVLEDAFTVEGLKAMGKTIRTSAKKLFAGDVKSISKRLGIRPDYKEVQVFGASSEDLVGMDLESVAGKEFAGGLKRTARFLKPRYHWYVVVLNRPKEVKAKDKNKRPKLDSADARIQLWVFSGGHYRLLGRIWRLDKVY